MSKSVLGEKGQVECETLSEVEVFAFDKSCRATCNRKFEVLETVAQNLDSTKYESEELACRFLTRNL